MSTSTLVHVVYTAGDNFSALRTHVDRLIRKFDWQTFLFILVSSDARPSLRLTHHLLCVPAERGDKRRASYYSRPVHFDMHSLYPAFYAESANDLSTPTASTNAYIRLDHSLFPSSRIFLCPDVIFHIPRVVGPAFPFSLFCKTVGGCIFRTSLRWFTLVMTKETILAITFKGPPVHLYTPAFVSP